MLSTAAFNALLKTLEEPPEHVKFMFATTDPEKVLPTILSRCQRFDLRRIPAALISKQLAFIAGKEKVKIDQAALYAIARGAEGAMRDAESTLDQLISFCGEKIEEADVLSMFGLAAQRQLLEVALLKAIEARSALSLDSVLKQLQGLREGNGREVVSIPMPVAASAPGPKPFRAEFSAMTPPETQAAQSSEATEARQLAPFSA